MISNQQKAQQSDDKLFQTQALTMQRYSTYLKVFVRLIGYNINDFNKFFFIKKEFDLLQFALSSARIFFRGEKEQVNVE